MHETPSGPRSGDDKVLHVYEPAVGGVPNYVRAVVAGHKAMGMTSASAGPPGPDVGTAAPDHVELFAGASKRVSVARNFRAVLRLFRIARGFDLLHGHSSVAGMMVAAVGLLRRVPTVYTPHTWSFQRDLPIVWRWAYVGLERLLARAHARVVTVSFCEAKAAVEYGVVNERKLDVVQTGVLPGSVLQLSRGEARSRLGCAEDETVIAWVGRNDPAKCPGDLAFIQIRLSGRARVLAMGIGLPGSSFGRSLTSAGGVVVDPAVGTSVLYAAADLFVMTSAWEASPLSVLEALSSGLPVVAYAVGDIPRMVKDRETGYLVPPGDREALVAGLSELSDDVGLRSSMGLRARVDVRERYAFDDTLRRLLDAYSSVLLRSRGGR